MDLELWDKSRWKLWTPGYLPEEETHQQRNHQQKTTEEDEGRSVSHTNSTQDLSGTTTKWWRNYSEQTTEQEQERILKTLYTWKNKLQHNLPTPAQQNTRCGGWSDPQLTSWREGHTKKRPNNNPTPKTYRQPTKMRAQDKRAQIKETAPLNLIGIPP